ncbi:apolipoprotein N-acyltransferase [Mariniluteicoccus endophyticus]
MSTTVDDATTTAAGPTVAWPRLLRPLATFVAGALTGLAFEPTNLWPLAVLGPAVFLWLLHPASGAPAHGAGERWFRHRGLGPGYLFGLGLCAVTLSWLQVLVPGAGPVIAAVLIVFEAVFFSLLGAVVRLVQHVPWWPVAVAGVWGSIEWLYGHAPFGGFGWIRLAYAVVDAPYAGLLPFLSVSGVSVGVALVAASLAWAALHRTRAGTVVALVAVVVPALLGLAGRSWTPAGTGQNGTVAIGMVQGNVDGVGVGGMGRARSVTNNHLSETVTLMARSRAGVQPMPDFVLWPENSTDIDPLQDAETRRTVSAASAVAGVPIFVGAVMDGPGTDERQTSGLWWMPDQTVAARYDKSNLVPFGEYIPFRAQLKPMLPILELVGAQSVAGTTPGSLDVPLADGRRLRVGDVICFELAYDSTVHEAVRGSEVVVVQSNNATYRGTAQPRQQWAMTRVRAMEARRDIVVATTNSLSGHIDARGRVLDQTREMVPASRTYVVPRQTGITPAMRYAGLVDLAVGLAALAGLLAAFSAKRGRPKAECRG